MVTPVLLMMGCRRYIVDDKNKICSMCTGKNEISKTGKIRNKVQTMTVYSY